MSVRPGDVVGGRYLVEKALAKGGMGAVYVALDQKFDKRIALKISFGAREDFEPRFKREAKIGNELGQVASFVRAFDWGVDDGKLYLAMGPGRGRPGPRFEVRPALRAARAILQGSGVRCPGP